MMYQRSITQAQLTVLSHMCRREDPAERPTAARMLRLYEDIFELREDGSAAGGWDPDFTV